MSTEYPLLDLNFAAALGFLRNLSSSIAGFLFPSLTGFSLSCDEILFLSLSLSLSLTSSTSLLWMVEARHHC
jgi:hypothetical protein